MVFGFLKNILLTMRFRQFKSIETTKLISKNKNVDIKFSAHDACQD